MNTAHYTEFNALTLKGIDLLSLILPLLAEEKTALTERDLDKITLLANQKSHILADFSTNIKTRIELLQRFNLETNKENIALFLDSCPDNTISNTCKSNWDKLEKSLCIVIDANTVNEQIAKKNQKNIDTILSILQGQKPNNMLYDAKGDKGDYSGQSRIGKA